MGDFWFFNFFGGGGGGGGAKGGRSASLWSLTLRWGGGWLSLLLRWGGGWLSLMLRWGGGCLVSFHLAMANESSSSVSSYHGFPEFATSSSDFSDIT